MGHAWKIKAHMSLPTSLLHYYVYGNLSLRFFSCSLSLFESCWITAVWKQLIWVKVVRSTYIDWSLPLREVKPTFLSRSHWVFLSSVGQFTCRTQFRFNLKRCAPPDWFLGQRWPRVKDHIENCSHLAEGWWFVSEKKPYAINWSFFWGMLTRSAAFLVQRTRLVSSPQGSFDEVFGFRAQRRSRRGSKTACDLVAPVSRVSRINCSPLPLSVPVIYCRFFRVLNWAYIATGETIEAILTSPTSIYAGPLLGFAWTPSFWWGLVGAMKGVPVR